MLWDSEENSSEGVGPRVGDRYPGGCSRETGFKWAEDIPDWAGEWPVGPPSSAEETSQGAVCHQGTIGEGRQREKKVVETQERIMGKVPWEY